MILQTIWEGLGLGALLVLVCAAGIRKGAVGMVHLYSPAVQQRCVKLGLTTHEKIKRNSLLFKAVCVPGYISYVLVCVYGINGARSFAAGFWQLLGILSVMNLIDRFLIDGYWVGHTNAWTIPGTEDLKPYITAKDKQKKWLCGSVDHAGTVIGQTGDEGIDGIIREDKLGFSLIYIQAKRWDCDKTVGRPEIQKFVGALAGQGASKGLFITTAKFTKEARQYAEKQHTTKVVLVDGTTLAKLMIEYDLGVSTEATYEIKRIDSDFFAEDLD